MLELLAGRAFTVDMYVAGGVSLEIPERPCPLQLCRDDHARRNHQQNSESCARGAPSALLE